MAINTVLNGNNTAHDYDIIRKRLDTKVKKIYFADDVVIESLGDVIYQLFFSGDTRCTFNKNILREKYQQRTGRLRSMEDTYVLASRYLPGITVEQVVAAVNAFLINKYYNKTGLIRSYCCTVRRYVHNPARNGTDKSCTKEGINSVLDAASLNFRIQQDVLQEVTAE